MRNPVELFLRLSRVVLLLGIVLAAAGDRMGWASPAGAPNKVNPAAPDPAGRDPAGIAPALSMPEFGPPMAGPRITLDAILIGTAVVEGGPSFAIFEGARGSRLVREGEEIVPGVRLVQVDWNWVDVERGGIRQEIRLGSSEAIPGGVRLGSSGGMPERFRLGSSEGMGEESRVSSMGGEATRAEAASAAVDRSRELRSQKRQMVQEGKLLRAQAIRRELRETGG